VPLAVLYVRKQWKCHAEFQISTGVSLKEITWANKPAHEEGRGPFGTMAGYEETSDSTAEIILRLVQTASLREFPRLL
jgi:hypothetical protein